MGCEISMKSNNFYITQDEYNQAFKNGISRHRLEQRIREYGWNKQKAIETPVRRNGSGRKRQYPESMVLLAEKNGINYTTFRARITKKGWSPKKAATTPLRGA